MPRSATGPTELDRIASTRVRSPARLGRGYTLIEILVVLVIASVLATAALLRIGGDSATSRVNNEAERLQTRLVALCERALLTGRPHGARSTPDGYDFWRLADGDWRPLPEGDRPSGHRWPDGLRAELLVRGTRTAPTNQDRPQLVCTSLEPFPPHVWALRLDDQQRRVAHPPETAR